MKLKHRPIGLLILTGLLVIAASRIEAKDQSKHLTNHRHDKAATQMSSKGTANHNAQWSADPTRGWVRAGERQELRKPSGAANRDKAKQKTKGKGY
ncbi:MAG: hypothetical protein ACXWXT_07715 [Candidatus Binatia bacterium]